MLYVKKYNPENMLKFPFESFISDAEKLMRNQFTEEKTIIKYPLTNIGYVGKKLVFEVALAGFKPENIKLTKTGNLISVKASYSASVSGSTGCKCSPCNPNMKYIQQNITFKDAERKFYLPESHMDGEIASKYVNGLLTIVVTPKTENYSDITMNTEDIDLLGNSCQCDCICNKPSEEPSEEEPSEPEEPNDGENGKTDEGTV